MNKKILVVEDDDGVRQLLCDLGESAGYDVIGLPYPDLVLDVASHERPDLILVDMMLPRHSGVEIADKLHINGFGHIPIIATSASPIMRDLARQTSVFQAVVSKPFDVNVLLEVIHATIEAPAPLGTLPRQVLPSVG